MTLTEAAAIKLRAEKRGRDWFVTSREVERYRVEHLRLNAVNRKGSGA